MSNTLPNVAESFGIADDGTPYHAETREALDRLSRIYGGGIVEAGS